MARTAQEMARLFRQRDMSLADRAASQRLATIREAARQERLADEARDRQKGRQCVDASPMGFWPLVSG